MEFNVGHYRVIKDLASGQKNIREVYIDRWGDVDGCGSEILNLEAMGPMVDDWDLASVLAKMLDAVCSQDEYQIEMDNELRRSKC